MYEEHPVASVCEHGHDPELQTDDVPSCMRICEANISLPHYIHQLHVHMLVVASLPKTQDGGVCVRACLGLTQSLQGHMRVHIIIKIIQIGFVSSTLYR
jgi:hypothetical protein